MPALMRWLPFLLFAWTLACKPALLPRTEIDDTPENREVAVFVLRYQHALQSRSVEEIMAMVADDYFEDNGTPGDDDDYDRAQLEEKLKKHFENIKSLRVDLHLQHVNVEEDGIHAIFKFRQRALVALPTGDTWVTTNDVNRLVLRAQAGVEGRTFKIVSGM